MYPYQGSPSWSSQVGFQAPQQTPGMMQPQMQQPQGALGAALTPTPGGGALGGMNQDMMKQMMINALKQKQLQQPAPLSPTNTLIPQNPMPG